MQLAERFREIAGKYGLGMRSEHDVEALVAQGFKGSRHIVTVSHNFSPALPNVLLHKLELLTHYILAYSA